MGMVPEEESMAMTVFNGPLLKKLRLEQIDPDTGRPWSHAALAFKLREEGSPITAQQVAKWEKNVGEPDRCEPQSRYLIAMARIFNRTPESFYRQVSRR
jgi:hypothetical protein